MASKLEKLQARIAKVRASQRDNVRQSVDKVEVLGGAFAAGVADSMVKDVMGARPSLLGGVAATTAGLATNQRDLAQVGLGMLAGNAYVAGQDAGKMFDGADGS